MKHGRPFFLKKKSPKEKTAIKQGTFFQRRALFDGCMPCLVGPFPVWWPPAFPQARGHTPEKSRKRFSGFNFVFVLFPKSCPRREGARKSKQASKQASRTRSPHCSPHLDPSVTEPPTHSAVPPPASWERRTFRSCDLKVVVVGTQAQTALHQFQGFLQVLYCCPCHTYHKTVHG